MEIQDPSQSVNVAPWYFNPAANVNGKTGWAKEPNSDSYDANGILTRTGMGEDRVAMLWNIDNSTPKFISQTCYNPHPNISVGLEMRSSGHDFEVFVGNYNYILPQNNALYNQNDFTHGQFLIGFNITRLWNF